jgi:hypothetical protein
MTTQRQTNANRRNALQSTGPRTENGKRRSRCNSYRHGLTAETVIVGLEDAAEYGAFESEIVTEYDPKSVVERELTRRLASLLWRLRRANLIEGGLLSIHAEIMQDRHQQPESAQRSEARTAHALIRGLGASKNPSDHGNSHEVRQLGNPESINNHNAAGDVEISASNHWDKQQAITRSFLRLADLASQPLERISRYEASLWRQFVQVLFALDQAKYHRIAASRGRFTPHHPQW